MNFFDSHSHYNDEKFENEVDEIIKKIYKEGITNIIIAGYNLESSKKAIELSQKFDFSYAICGISPNDITNKLDNDLNEIRELTKNKKVVAIGEIGLDYYWNKDNKELQKQAFIKQIEIANEMNLPIVIHSRDAIYDTIDILNNKIQCKNKGVFHCCQLNIELVKNALEQGYYISFAGPITYKNSKNASEIIKMVPLNKILIETDCPYLAPEPVRGTKNDSRNLKYIAQKIADIKQIELEQIANNTIQNTKTIFRI